MAKPSRRVMIDIQNIHSDEVRALNIHYKEDNSNMFNGMAFLLGPEGTPYQDLPILLEITFPTDYPFSNPKVSFKTYDGHTRFHPNLYTGGKVCLSILGTWTGPSWTSVMTLKTVLLSIMGLLDDAPLLHEPGYNSKSKSDPQTKAYTEYVEYSSLCYIVDALVSTAKKTLKHPLSVFEEEFRSYLPEIFKRTVARLEKHAMLPKKTLSAVQQSLTVETDFKGLLDKLNSVKKLIET